MIQLTTQQCNQLHYYDSVERLIEISVKNANKPLGDIIDVVINDESIQPVPLIVIARVVSTVKRAYIERGD